LVERGIAEAEAANALDEVADLARHLVGRADEQRILADERQRTLDQTFAGATEEALAACRQAREDTERELGEAREERQALTAALELASQAERFQHNERECLARQAKIAPKIGEAEALARTSLDCVRNPSPAR